MKIAIFTEAEYVYLYPAWQATLAALAREGHTIAGIWVFPDTLKGMRGMQIPMWYLRTFGLAVTAGLAWRTIAARCRAIGGFAALARQRGIPYHHAANPNDTAVVAWVKEQGIDVVCITLGYIIKPPLLAAVRRAVVNKHSALLPADRGLLPVFWSMSESGPVGVTVHEVSAEIDAGRILVQRAYPEARGSVAEAYALIYRDMPALLTQALQVLGGQPPVVVDLPRVPSYHSLPTRADVRRFFASGKRFI